jgi:hypothetical protein
MQLCQPTFGTNKKQKISHRKAWLNMLPVSLLHIHLLTCLQILWQGKEYVFVANSDNLGAIVDMSILTKWSNFVQFLYLNT